MRKKRERKECIGIEKRRSGKDWSKGKSKIRKVVWNGVYWNRKKKDRGQDGMHWGKKGKMRRSGGIGVEKNGAEEE